LIVARSIRKLKPSELDLIRNCTFGPLNEPIESVRLGEELIIETCDCYGDVVTPDQPLEVILRKGLLIFENPVTGSLFVEGAERRDALVVEIIDIELPEMGIITMEPKAGALRPWRRNRPRGPSS